MIYLKQLTMGMLQAKPIWADTDPEGSMKCTLCQYKTSNKEHLQEHTGTYHPEDPMYVLYTECTGSIEGRSEICDLLEDFQYIDCTGGQMAFEDSDLDQFYDELIQASHETGHKLGRVVRMYYPGLGLDFPDWWVQGGIAAGVFQERIVPEDVKATWAEPEPEPTMPESE